MPLYNPTLRMAFTAGTRLGPYEIGTLIGAGGMGEVYRATDTHLKRAVAIKVLPSSVDADPERLARFEREAQVLASLNHPNIAQIFAIERLESARALIMELVDGETLAERIARGPLPVDETLSIARQIAEGIEAAHDRGVVHRDLKPSNVKLRPDGTVKVLDFGLAKALEPIVPGTPNASASPTITSPAATAAGVLLGTAAYMSPEQARGLIADKRSDVWAFGCVMYEMLTGRRPFDGETISDTLAAVLRAEPDWNVLPRDVPPAIHALLRLCLEKDRRRRVADVSTARLVFDVPELIPSPTQPSVRWRAITAAVVALIVAGGFAIQAWKTLRDDTPPRSLVKFAIPLPADQAFSNGAMPLLALSPDGEHIAYAANGRLYLRSLSDTAPRAIPGSEGAPLNPTFSPDGESIAYFDMGPPSAREGRPLPTGSIKRIRRTGGTPITVCDTAYPFGISWGADGLVFGQAGKGVMRVSLDSGEPQQLVPVNEDEIASGPQILPGGRAVLFTYASNVTDLLQPQENPTEAAWDTAQIVVHSLDDGSRKTLIDGGSDGRYLPSGHIVYAVSGTLRAVPFDLTRLAVIGPAVAVLEGVARVRFGNFTSTGLAQFATSATGSLVYIAGPLSGSAPPRDLALYDRGRAREALGLPPMLYEAPRTSPNGQEVAVGAIDSGNTNVWIYDLSRKAPPRQLTLLGRNRYPTWSADGRRVTFQSDRDGDLAIYSQPADGSRPAQRLTQPEPGTAHIPQAWSPKDEYLLFSTESNSTFTLWTFAARDRTVARFADDVSSRALPGAVFSPDGRWVAYHAGEPPDFKLFVRSFPDAAAVYQLPAIAARNPRWSPDGKQLFYTQGPRIYAMGVTTNPKFAFETPTPLVDGIPMGFAAPGYDIVDDGKRFIGMIVARGYTPLTASSIRQIDVALNWTAELQDRVPNRQ